MMQIKYEKLLLDENNLIYCQDFKLNRFTSPFHFHNEYELLLIEKSQGKLYVGNTVTNFTDGELFFFASGLPHCFYNNTDNLQQSGLTQAAMIHLRKELFGQDFIDKTETVQLKKLLERSEFGIKYINPSKTLITRFLQIKHKRYLEKVSDIFLILSELSREKDFELLCAENIAYKMNFLDSIIINDVFQYITENLQETITLDQAASIANMQKSAFCKYFKRKTKKKFTQVVNEVRIIHAKKLLAETDQNIMDIAFECGYDTVSYFYRQFKLYCNATPIEFRKQLQHKPL